MNEDALVFSQMAQFVGFDFVFFNMRVCCAKPFRRKSHKFFDGLFVAQENPRFRPRRPRPPPLKIIRLRRFNVSTCAFSSPSGGMNDVDDCAAATSVAFASRITSMQL